MRRTPAPLLSPLASRCRDGAAESQPVNGYDVIVTATEANLSGLRLTDLTHVARAGFKGRGSSTWLARQGIAIPAAPNSTMLDASGCLIARLGHEDFLIAGPVDAHSELPATLLRAWQTEHDAGIRDIGFPTPKQYSHALIHLGGSEAAALLSLLCAVDLRPRAFAIEALAQTLAAGVVASFMRCDRGGVLGYLMLVDTSYAAYCWDAMVDAIAGFGEAL